MTVLAVDELMSTVQPLEDIPNSVRRPQVELRSSSGNNSKHESDSYTVITLFMQGASAKFLGLGVPLSRSNSAATPSGRCNLRLGKWDLTVVASMEPSRILNSPDDP